MVALTQPRNTPAALGDHRHFQVGAGARIFAGSMVAVTAAGFAVPAAAVAALTSVGRAEETVDNRDGANGAVNIKTRRGTFQFANSAGADAIGPQHTGKRCYVVDDQTVALTDGGGARPIAGNVFGVDPQGVWVEFL